MKITIPAFLAIFVLCNASVNAQTGGDSVLISRSHFLADSILRAINGRSPVAPSSVPAAANTPSLNSDAKTDTPQSVAPPAQIRRSPSADFQSKHSDSLRALHHWGNDSLGHFSSNPDSSVRHSRQQGVPPPYKAPDGSNAGKSMPMQGAGGPGATGGMVPANLQSMIQNMKMSIGHIYGKVIDGQSKKPMSYVSASLYTMRDSLVTGQLTEDNGDFSFSDLRAGAYNVKVTFLGYKDVLAKVVVTPNKSDVDVGNLSLVQDATQLKEVDVTAQKTTVELKVDRKVFNVGNDISARGGTGLDVMKNIPSVSVDAGGNVTLRNNTPQVYVDGKPTTLTLEQIPADQIEKVEVITNPSAKFEAASSGGIINVVMKHNTKPGYNGMVNLNLATNTGYNGMAMLNLKEKKFGINLLYTVNGATNRTNGYNNTSGLDSTDRSNYYINQNINSTFKRLFQVARAGLDFYINNRNTLSMAENAVFGNFNTDDAINITAGAPGAAPTYTGSQNNNQLNHFRNFNTDISLKHTYPKEGKEYTLDFQYNHSNGGGNYLYNTAYYFQSGNIYPMNPTNEFLYGAQHADMFTAIGDFSIPIGSNMKIETGFRCNYKLTYSYNNIYNDSTNSGIATNEIFNPGLSNNYRIDDLVSGAYITFTHMIKGFSYQLGFRAEQVYYKGTSYLNGDSAFAYQYPTDWGSVPKMLFPSFNLSQKWGTKHELQINVARKSNRPNFFQIAPFVFSSNATTIQRGNPNLQPEFINQGEVNYNMSLKVVSWLSSVYVRYVQQPISNYSIYEPASNPQFISTYENGNHSLAGGWENTVKLFPVKKLDVTLTGNVFYTTIQGGSNENNNNNAGWSWLAKAIISYKLPMDFTIQGNGTYEAPRIVPQGKTIPLYYFDLSLSKDFGFFTLNFTVSDVLNSKTSGTSYYQASAYDNATNTWQSGFTQQTSRRRDQRYARLGVSFRFGKMDASLFKKKRPQMPDQNGGDIGF